MNFMLAIGNVRRVKTLFTRGWIGVPDVRFPELAGTVRITSEERLAHLLWWPYVIIIERMLQIIRLT
jgi:hypothetical protein